MTGPILVLAAVFGLLIGSFLNVVAYRVPAGMSVVTPGSACPGCHTAISARDNVPVLSWLLLRARCRHCSMRIPARYLAVEAGTALAFVVAAMPFTARMNQAPPSPAAVVELVAYLYLAAASVVLAVIDLDVRRLPDAIVLPSYGVGIVLLGLVDLLRGDAVAAGTAAAGAGASVVFYGLLWLAKPGGMGLGDVKLAGVLGLFLGNLGIEPLLVGATAAFVLGGVFGVALILLRRAGRRTAVPFGPWMLAGAWVGILSGSDIAAWYLSVTGLS